MVRDEVMAPVGYYWEDEKVEEIAWQTAQPMLYYTNENDKRNLH
jgi:hypothetical protein